MNKHLEKRFWEIDFLRGLAIIMMIVFHLLYDLTTLKKRSHNESASN